MQNKTKVKYKVVPFRPGIDSPGEIASIHLKIREWQVKIGQNWFPNMKASQKDLLNLEQFYITSGGNFFIAKDKNGKIIGFVGLKNEKGTGVFKRLAVVPEYHRKGVAKALVSEAIDWAKQNGFKKFSLRTGITEHARPLYEQFGFRVIRYNEDRKDLTMETEL